MESRFPPNVKTSKKNEDNSIVHQVSVIIFNLQRNQARPINLYRVGENPIFYMF